MSRSSVRHAAALYLSAPQLPGIGRVYASPPKIARSSDSYEGLPPGTPSGSVVFVEVMEAKELRLALGGTKRTNYALRFHLLFRSLQQAAEDAMDDHDDQVEAILERLRMDQTLGTSGAIIQVGQDPSGISIATGMPKAGGNGTTHIWTIIDAVATELLTA